MKKSIWILCLTLAITEVLFFENSVNAVLNISGNVVQDSNTGLEWLAISETVNKSPDRIRAGDYGLKAAGWALATVAQIETLLINAGFKQPYNASSNFDAANHLVALFGYTYEYNGEDQHELSIQACSATPGESPSTLYSPLIFVGLTPWGFTGNAQFPGTSFSSNIASPTSGNWLVRANPAISPPTFDSNSGTLTNNYVPLKVRDKLTSKTYGYPSTIYSYIEGRNHETLDQVKCLKIKNSASYSLTAVSYYWLAQDTTGNIWIFQYHNVESNDLRYYGRNYAKIFMPFKVNVGSGLWNPDAVERVVSTGVTVPKLRTGLGPYYNCIETKIINPDGDIDYQYFAPDVGPVKAEFNDDGGINGLEISLIESRSISLPFLQLLLE